METIQASEFRNEYSEIINQVCYKGKSILLERHGKPVAVLLSVDEYERLLRNQQKAKDFISSGM